MSDLTIYNKVDICDAVTQQLGTPGVLVLNCLNQHILNLKMDIVAGKGARFRGVGNLALHPPSDIGFQRISGMCPPRIVQQVADLKHMFGQDLAAAVVRWFAWQVKQIREDESMMNIDGFGTFWVLNNKTQFEMHQNFRNML